MVIEYFWQPQPYNIHARTWQLTSVISVINVTILLLKKVQLSSLNIVDMDTNRRMSDLLHGDLEILAQLILVGSEKDTTSNLIGTSGQLAALEFQRGLWHVDDPTLIYHTDNRVLMPSDRFMCLGGYMFKASRDMKLRQKASDAVGQTTE